MHDLIDTGYILETNFYIVAFMVSYCIEAINGSSAIGGLNRKYQITWYNHLKELAPL